MHKWYRIEEDNSQISLSRVISFSGVRLVVSGLWHRIEQLSKIILMQVIWFSDVCVGQVT